MEHQENKIEAPVASPANKQNFLTVPLAIIVAGLLIGGSIIYSNKTKSGDGAGRVKEASPAPSEEIIIEPVTESDHVLGNRNAPIMFVEYSDIECPFCKMFHATMHKVIDTYGKDGKVAWTYRHFPIDQLHPKARREAEATECANELSVGEKFWRYLDRIYEITPSNNGLDPAKLETIAVELNLDKNKFKNCLESGKYKELIQKQFVMAVKAGGQGTPHTTIILKEPLSGESRKTLEAIYNEIRDPDGQLIITIGSDSSSIVMRGSLPYEIIKTTLDEMLK